MFKIIAFIALCLTLSANAWWCTGHMTVAYVALQNLNSNARTKVESMAAALSASGPFPQTPDFMQMACWADDLKSQGLEPMEGWHFINQPYDPSNYPIQKWPIQTENVEVLIRQLDATLKKKNAPAWDLNFALGNLVHFYGDIHQPLHATELFSSVYPNGDYGGNLESVTVDGTSTKLHFIWDSICWEYSAELNRPLSSTDKATVTNFGDYLMNTYTFSSSQKSEYNSTIFAQESLNDAITYAYPGTYNGMTIDAAYLAKCKPVAEGRVALAGYRLASQLNYLFGSSSEEETNTDDWKTAKAKEIRDHIVHTHVALGNKLHEAKDLLNTIRKTH